MFSPGIFVPMFPRAGDAADEVAHSLEIEGALHFSVNQLP